MGALCGCYDNDDDDGETGYELNMALLPLLGITPVKLCNKLALKAEQLDRELKLLRQVLQTLSEEGLLGEARFCSFGRYVGLQWSNAETGNSMHCFVGEIDVQTRSDRRGNGGLILGVTDLGLKPCDEDFPEKLRESLRRCKERMDEPLDKALQRLVDEKKRQ